VLRSKSPRRLPTGELAVGAELRLGRDQVADAECARNRAGDEAVGRGDDGQQVAVGTVPVHQFARRVKHGRADHLVHELAMPGVELRAREAGQRAERELEVLDRVQRTVLVLGEELRVARGEAHRIDGADAAQELAPLVVGVDRQQRMVEVEKREVHHGVAVSPSCSSSRSSGIVIGRWVSSE
jgi:hypothetical protein